MNRKFKIAGLLGSAAIAVSAALGIAGAASPNIVKNGDFNEGSKYWATINEGAFVKSPGQGAVLTNTNDSILASDFWLYQCINVDSGWERLLTARLNIPEGQGRSGSAHYEVRFHEAAGCSGASMDSDISPAWALTDGWQDTQLKLWRHNGKKASSLALVVVVHKNMPSQAIKKDLPFFVVIDDISIVETESGDPQVAEEPTATPTKQPHIIPPAAGKTATPTATPKPKVSGDSGNGGTPTGTPSGTPAANPGDGGSGAGGDDFGAGQLPGGDDSGDSPANQDANGPIGEAPTGDGFEVEGPAVAGDGAVGSFVDGFAEQWFPGAPSTGNSGPTFADGTSGEFDLQQVGDDGPASPWLFGGVLASALGLFGLIVVMRRRKLEEGA